MPISSGLSIVRPWQPTFACIVNRIPSVAAAAPTFFCGPIVGALADKYGAEWIMLPSIILTLPWLPLMLLNNSLAGFIIFFAFASE